jgi:hypothetical protein
MSGLLVGALRLQKGPMQSAAIKGGRDDYRNWSFVESKDILANYPKGTGMPIVLYSCLSAESTGISASLSYQAGAVVYAAQDYAFSRQLNPGVT